MKFALGETVRILTDLTDEHDDQGNLVFKAPDLVGPVVARTERAGAEPLYEVEVATSDGRMLSGHFESDLVAEVN